MGLARVCLRGSLKALGWNRQPDTGVPRGLVSVMVYGSWGAMGGVASRGSRGDGVLLTFLALLKIVMLITIINFFVLHGNPRVVRKRTRMARCHISDGMPKHVLRFHMGRKRGIRTKSALTVLRTPSMVTGVRRTHTTRTTTRTRGRGTVGKTHRRRVRTTCRV